MLKPQVLDENSVHLFARVGPVWVVLSRDAPTMESMDTIGRALDRACAQYETVGFLVQVPGGVKPPGSGPRKRAGEILSKNGSAIRCAMVLEGTGFWASATRSVFTAITVLSGGAKTKVFPSVPASYEWIAAEVGVEADDLAEAIGTLRARSL